MNKMQFFICKTIRAALSINTCKRNRRSLPNCRLCKSQQEFQDQIFTQEQILNNEHLSGYNTISDNQNPMKINKNLDLNFIFSNLNFKNENSIT